MRRLLTLLLATLGVAHAAYCFDVPGEDRTLLPRLQGTPRQVTEVRSEANPAAPDAPATVTTRTFTLEGGRVTRVLTSAQGGLTGSLLTLTPGTGHYQQLSRVSGENAGRAQPITLTDLQAAPRTPVAVQFDTQGRLTAYSGVWEDRTRQAVKEQVSCTYSSANRQVVERVTRAGAVSQVTTAQLDARSRLILREITVSLPPGTGAGPGAGSTRQTTYTYAPDGTGIRVEDRANGELLPAQLMTTDAAGRVTRIEMADLGDVQEQWRIEYDAQGNWVRQTGTMQGQTFMTVTRRVTY
ncbi:hypothetical protein GCM10008959_38440 [Deinococcus seoulensis]|uniref:RHS repeat protein n=1 Tax=Deinococcus seoulensis TaxID=1837379 RepID=A0ABQ2RWR2_9DEIO|nr:hypothetical protein [Deinococcus seoulensis]GGR73345.1 hypothetical protein GCM10008959_38440 [Deinococcus seoulensis]